MFVFVLNLVFVLLVDCMCTFRVPSVISGASAGASSSWAAAVETGAAGGVDPQRETRCPKRCFAESPAWTHPHPSALRQAAQRPGVCATQLSQMKHYWKIFNVRKFVLSHLVYILTKLPLFIPPPPLIPCFPPLFASLQNTFLILSLITLPLYESWIMANKCLMLVFSLQQST